MATFGTFVAGQTLTAAELNTAGVWAGYTPTWTQSVAITKTVNWARYMQLGKFVQVSIKMTSTGAGNADNKILVGLPVAASANNYIVGRMAFLDASGTTVVQTSIDAYYESSTTVGFAPAFTVSGGRLEYIAAGAQGTTTRFGQNFTDGSGGSRTGLTVASNDIIFCQFAYEAD
jgi:hypothetical protein